MPNYVADLDSVFHALADPGRRLMLERLGQGPASVSELGKSLPMSLAAVVQHVQVLEASGLVRTQKLGRTRMCSPNLVPLRSAERWISERRAFVGGLSGDAAAAAVLTRSAPYEKSAIWRSQFVTYSSGANLTEMNTFHMDGPTIFKFAAQQVGPFLDRFFEPTRMGAE